MKVSIFLIGSPLVVQLELPNEQNFLLWTKVVRADGGIFSDQLHIPYDKIIGMGLADAAPMAFVAPGTETKQ